MSEPLPPSAARVQQALVAHDSPFRVVDATGYVIGGVPPIGFPQPIETWIDADLLQFAEVWAAAGTPFAVFSLDPNALASLTGGTVVQVSRGAS